MQETGGLFKPSRFNANGLAPRRAFRRERPNDRQTTPHREKADGPKGLEPKSKLRRSNSNIRRSRRSPALAKEPGPHSQEVLAVAQWSPLLRPAEVLRERAQALVPEVGRKSLLQAEGPHRQVGGPRIHSGPLRPSQPMSKTDEIDSSYAILIASWRKKFHPELLMTCG
jgi:hypothetical protein